MREERQSKRGFKKRYLLMMLLFMGLVAFGFFRRHTHHQLKQRIETLRHQGYPMSPAELDVWYKESFPDDVDKGWDLYSDAFWEYVEWSDQKSENLPGYNREIRYGRGETWEPIHLAAAKAFLADNKNCLDLLYEAAEAGHARAPYDFSQGRALLLPELGEARKCARLLQLAGETAVMDGDFATFVLTSRALLSLAESVNAPHQICHIVRLSLDGMWAQMMEFLLNIQTLSERHLQTLEIIVDQPLVGHGYAQSLMGERALNLELFNASSRDIEMAMRINHENNSPGLWSPIIDVRRLLGLHDLDALSYINAMQASIEAAALLTHEAQARLIAIEEARHENLGSIARRLVSTHSRVHRIVIRRTARLQCVRTALAVERYRLASGRLPDTLRELVPDFLESAPHDPRDGQQLRYSRRDAGYVIYSIGQDLTDNQGEERKTGKAKRDQKEWDETFIVER